MDQKKIRVGIIGCGGIAQGHIMQLLRVPEAEIVALCDVKEERIEWTKKNFSVIPSMANAKAFSDYKEMLESVELDAVEIHTPHTLHYEQIMASLDKGLHVLVEKPMVCKVSHAKDVVAKAKEKGKVVLVSYQRHYQPQFRYIKQVIESGELGSVQFISALQSQDWYRGTKGTWRQDPLLSGGGQINDSGSHLIDIILWTTGLHPKSVFSFMNNLDSKVDINSSLSIRFVENAEASIAIVGNSPCWWEDITIWGTKGAIFYRNGRLQHWPEGGKAILEPIHMPRGGNPDSNFINAILGKEQVESPPECGLRVIELTEAAWRSAAEGRMVEVSEVSDIS